MTGGEQRPSSRASFPEIYEQALVGPLFEPWVADLLEEIELGPRDRVLDVLNSWVSLLRQCILDAQASGEIDPRKEVDQVVFEIQAMLLAANFLFVMTNDPIRLTQARKGVENVLARVAARAEPKKKRPAR